MEHLIDARREVDVDGGDHAGIDQRIVAGRSGVVEVVVNAEDTADVYRGREIDLTRCRNRTYANAIEGA